MIQESWLVHHLLRNWDHLEVKDGLLFYIKTGANEASQSFLSVTPSEPRPSVLEYSHSSIGHLGLDKMLCQIKERYLWPGLCSDVHAYIKKCRWKTPKMRRQAPQESICMTRPMELVCINFLSLERSKGGYEHVLVSNGPLPQIFPSVPNQR